MDTQFSDVAPWPADTDRTLGDEAAGRHHNRPPLEERIVMDFAEKLAIDGVTRRVDELVQAAERAPACDSSEVAGKYGDLIKMASAATKRVDEAREALNRPLLTAQRALKARADGVVEPLTAAANRLRGGLNGFLAEEERKAAAERARIDEQRRAAEEAARKVAEEQAAKAAEAGELIPEPTYEPVFVAPEPVAAPVARGDLGARVGTTTVWKHRIDSIRQLPDAILKNAKVIEALDKVIAAQIRGGAREIKGCTIWDEKIASVR